MGSGSPNQPQAFQPLQLQGVPFILQRCAICSAGWIAIAQPMPRATERQDSIGGLHLEGAVGKLGGLAVTATPCLFQVVSVLCVWLDVPASCFLPSPILSFFSLACPLELCLGAQQQMGFVSSLALKCPGVEKCQIK